MLPSELWRIVYDQADTTVSRIETIMCDQLIATVNDYLDRDAYIRCGLCEQWGKYHIVANVGYNTIAIEKQAWSILFSLDVAIAESEGVESDLPHATQ